MRSGSVLMPRSTRKHSKGDITPPAAFWISRKRSLCSGLVPMSAPPRPSEWPLRYLVVECITMSAPSASGLCSTGDRNVLSTLTSAPCAWAIFATAAMSVSTMSGLLGVSMCTSLVFGFIAASTAARLLVSTYSISMP